MSAIRFEWASTIAASNLRKHGIAFEEARLIADPDHSSAEERFVLIGLGAAGRRRGASGARRRGCHPHHLGAQGRSR